MYGDIIHCFNCGKDFKDTTNKTDKLSKSGKKYQWKGQDSREGNFKNMCPYCYGTNTQNTHKKTKKKQKFKYQVTHKNGETKFSKNIKRIKKPIMNTNYIAKEVLGDREFCNICEEKKNFASSFERTLPEVEAFTPKELAIKSGGTFNIQRVKSFTPQELMQQKLNKEHRELLASPNNYKRYKGWRYDKRLK